MLFKYRMYFVALCLSTHAQIQPTFRNYIFYNKDTVKKVLYKQPINLGVTEDIKLVTS